MPSSAVPPVGALEKVADSHPPAAAHARGAQLTDHFTSGLQTAGFDMDDTPHAWLINEFPLLQQASAFLDAELVADYNAANDAALKHQSQHRILAKIAITAGGLSIVLAVIQLALKSTIPESAHMVAPYEVAAAILACVAVVGGLFSKHEHKWLIKRHIAERLRMLKFRALGNARLWNLNMSGWQSWVKDEAGKIKAISDLDEVKAWAGEDFTARNTEQPPQRAWTEDDRALAIYYREKRVNYQAAYFNQQSTKLGQHTSWLSHAGLPLFMGSIVSVMVHFAADYLREHEVISHGTISENAWNVIGVWALALAVLLPVVSLCFRAWIGAFEYSRSSYLFQAKHKALQHFSGYLQTNISAHETMRRMEEVEDFLEHEHKEWLRLVMSAEWFI